VIAPPPSSIVYTVERWAPGFWQDFVDAVWAGYRIWGQPIDITSWYRGVTENMVAGGHPDSNHLVGAAIDILPADQALLDAFRRVGFVGRVTDHTHLQAWPVGVARNSGLLAAVGV
jgi:hypothetical protein